MATKKTKTRRLYTPEEDKEISKVSGPPVRGTDMIKLSKKLKRPPGSLVARWWTLHYKVAVKQPVIEGDVKPMELKVEEVHVKGLVTPQILSFHMGLNQVIPDLPVKSRRVVIPKAMQYEARKFLKATFPDKVFSIGKIAGNAKSLSITRRV